MKYLIYFLLVLSSACAHQKINTELKNIPESFKHQNPNELDADFEKINTYWKSLNDPKLDDLIEQLLAKNLELQASTLRIASAFKQAKIKFAELTPKLGPEAGLDRSRKSLTTGQPVDAFGIPRTSTLYSAGLKANWEIDIWGALALQYKAAKHQALQKYLLHQITRQNLISQFIQTYYELRYNLILQATLKADWEMYHQEVSALKVRHNVGLNPPHDYIRMYGKSVETKVAYEAAQLSYTQIQARLAILLGENPTLFELKLANPELNPIPKLAIKLAPSFWLTKRSDIKASEQNVLAAKAMAGSALRDFFPKFNFALSAGFVSLGTNNLFTKDSSTYNFGPIMSWPILNPAKLILNYQSMTAEAKAALADYQQVVLKAFGEVETNLQAYQFAQADYQELMIVWEAANKINVWELNKKRNGLLSVNQYGPIIHDVQLARRSLAMQHLKLIASFCDLMRSFGGGA